MSVFYPSDWHTFYHFAEQKGYSGTAILGKKQPDQVSTDTPWPMINSEGRMIRADYGDLSIVSLYLPSGSAKQTRQDLKMAFLIDDFLPYLRDLRNEQRRYILCGDWNIAHKKIDLKNWYSNQNRSGFLPEERAWMDQLFDELGYIDAFREVNNEAEQYTWWSNRGNAWHNNTGWRIDYQVLTPNLKNTVRAEQIYKAERFSDHAPLIIDYDLAG